MHFHAADEPSEQFYKKIYLSWLLWFTWPPHSHFNIYLPNTYVLNIRKAVILCYVVSKKCICVRSGGSPWDVFYCIHEEHQLHFFGRVHVVVIKILRKTPNEIITNILRALNRASINDLLNGNHAKCWLNSQNRADQRLYISLCHSAGSIPDPPCLNHVPNILPIK